VLCCFIEIVEKILWMERKIGGKEEKDQRKTSGWGERVKDKSVSESEEALMILVDCQPFYLDGDRALVISARALMHTASCIRKRKMFYLNLRKKSSIQMQVQFRLKALGFMIFDPNQLTGLESVIYSLLLSRSDGISLLRSSIIANRCVFFFRPGSEMRLPIKKLGLGCAIVLK